MAAAEGSAGAAGRTDAEGSTCSHCQLTSYHPVDRAKGWCSHCARFFGVGEGPQNWQEYRRYNERRFRLLRKSGRTPDEEAEYQRLAEQVTDYLAAQGDNPLGEETFAGLEGFDLTVIRRVLGR